MAVTDQKANFRNRVNYLNSPAGRAGAARIVGIPEEENSLTVSRISQLYMVPFALAVGAFCWLLARVILFNITSEGEYFTSEFTVLLVESLGDITIAVVLALVLSKIFNLGRGMRLLALLAGFGGAMFYEGALIARFPEFFTLVYSEAYVAEIVSGLNTVL